MDNIGEKGTLGVLQTMSPSNDFEDTRRYVEFKAAFRQVFPIPSSKSTFYEKGSRPERDSRSPYRKDGGSSS